MLKWISISLCLQTPEPVRFYDNRHMRQPSMCLMKRSSFQTTATAESNSSIELAAAANAIKRTARR
jgi:hypothetical protein